MKWTTVRVCSSLSSRPSISARIDPISDPFLLPGPDPLDHAGHRAVGSRASRTMNTAPVHLAPGHVHPPSCVRV
jgi:hypothetical protein